MSERHILQMTDTITLTIKEVREARGDTRPNQCFLKHGSERCWLTDGNPDLDCRIPRACFLCKKLTEFAKEGKDE